MRSFLVLVLLVVSFEAVRSCESICEFLYNNPDWVDHSNIDDTSFEDTVERGRVTGIITASFHTFPSSTYIEGKTWDYLRFYTRNRESETAYQALVFRISWHTNTNFVIHGTQINRHILVGSQYETVTGKTANIQISDQNSDFYKIYLGDPGVVESLEYNFKSNETAWNWFQDNNVRLQDTVRIKNDGRCTVYKYISACSDPTPRLCDEQQTVTDTVNLGSSYTLTCTGSGAPYLDVKWTKDGEPTDVQPSNTHTTTKADHRIESTVTISSITTDHLGTWTCTILNKNFENSVTKTYTLLYIISSPDLDYYKDSDGDTEFQWVVQGLPLEQVTLDCGSEGTVTRDESGYITSKPPQIKLTLTLRNEDVVNCALKDRNNVLETREITRVGYNCEAGEGGVGKDCEVCPTGQTSVPGVGKCFTADSTCTEGYWGSKENCQECPENQTSRPHTVKIQECFPDVSHCKEGTYGYENTCTQCPEGKTSKVSTKLVRDCVEPIGAGYKVTLSIAWSLLGVFLLTTVLLATFAARNFLRSKCTWTTVDSEHEYVDNVITQPPSKLSAGKSTEAVYNNNELYEL